MCSFSDKDEISSAEDHSVNDGVCMKVVRMDGIGKFPYVVTRRCSKSSTLVNYKLPENSLEAAKEVILDFGSVAVGDTVEKWIDIDNPSPVSKPD